MPEPDDRRDDLLLVIEHVSSIVKQQDLQALLEATIGAAIELTGARFGALGVVNEHGRLVDFHHKGLSSQDAHMIGDPPVGRGILGDIMRHGVVVRTPDIVDHAGYTGIPENHPEMSSFLGVPVKVGDRVFGNLYITEKPGGFDEQDEVMAKALATAAGAGINAIRMGQELRDRAIVEDRDRIARDVHDSIIQNLFAVGLDLAARSEATDDPELRAALGNDTEAIDASITELRRLIYDLHTDVPRRASLTEEVTELVDRLGGPHDVPITVSLEGDLPVLDDAVIDDLLQIVREAISNALRHSGATSISVSLAVDVRSLFLSITDDGCGFDVRGAPRGLGLANMRTRARRAGGDLEVASSEGRGTSVEARIPVPDASGSARQPSSFKKV
ncbi:MAG: hypothetical protein BMS9Abin20_1150 [Acidimicrobiia bacterium]|nr:MAG: hypothetical protein BMS9Abin20_1150 [Acidimicrobiia bacterium]